MSDKVKWNGENKVLFERLMANTPEQFKEIASKATKEKAESIAKERGSEFVEIDDIAKACLVSAPPIFKPQIINDLKREGIDADKYL